MSRCQFALYFTSLVPWGGGLTCLWCGQTFWAKHITRVFIPVERAGCCLEFSNCLPPILVTPCFYEINKKSLYCCFHLFCLCFFFLHSDLNLKKGWWVLSFNSLKKELLLNSLSGDDLRPIPNHCSEWKPKVVPCSKGDTKTSPCGWPPKSLTSESTYGPTYLWAFNHISWSSPTHDVFPLMQLWKEGRGTGFDV